MFESGNMAPLHHIKRLLGLLWMDHVSLLNTLVDMLIGWIHGTKYTMKKLEKWHSHVYLTQHCLNNFCVVKLIHPLKPINLFYNISLNINQIYYDILPTPTYGVLWSLGVSYTPYCKRIQNRKVSIWRLLHVIYVNIGNR